MLWPRNKYALLIAKRHVYAIYGLFCCLYEFISYFVGICTSIDKFSFVLSICYYLACYYYFIHFLTCESTSKVTFFHPYYSCYIHLLYLRLGNTVFLCKFPFLLDTKMQNDLIRTFYCHPVCRKGLRYSLPHFRHQSFFLLPCPRQPNNMCVYG